MNFKKPLFDWMVHFGFYPYHPVDCTVSRVTTLLGSGGVTHAAIASYRGLFYDALAGNFEVAETTAELNRIPGNRLAYQAVGSFNPHSGWPKVVKCIESALSQGIQLFRLYPSEQGWTMAHSVFVRATEMLNASAIRAVLVEDQFRNIITLRNLLSDHIAIITSPHFYSMSEWMDELFKLPEVYLTIRRLQGPGVISDIVRNHGSDRLLYASDTPLGSTGAINRMLASEPGYEGLLDRIWENGNKILEGRV